MHEKPNLKARIYGRIKKRFAVLKILLFLETILLLALLLLPDESSRTGYGWFLAVFGMPVAAFLFLIEKDTQHVKENEKETADN